MSRSKQSQKGCAVIVGVLGALGLIALIILMQSPDSALGDTQDQILSFKESGYTKTSDRYRLFVYAYYLEDSLASDSAKIKAIEQHARNQMHTGGRSTTVYYYKESAPPAKTYEKLETHRRYLDQYRAPDHVFMIQPDGSLQAL